MVVPLLGALRADATLLQQIMRYITTDHLAFGIVVDLNELAEARRVIVPSGLGIAKGLQHGIGWKRISYHKEVILKRYFSRHTIQYLGLYGSGTVVRIAQVFEQVFGGLCLSGTRLAGHDDRLRQLVDPHISYGFIRCWLILKR